MNAHADPRTRDRCAAAIATMPTLELASNVNNGPMAVSLLQRGECDLLILDLDLTDVDWLRLVRRLRGSDAAVEIIAVTELRSVTTVRSTLQAGVLDYIVKPFGIERLRRSLGMFLSRASALSAPELDQNEIDRAVGAGRLPRRWLPKGLSAKNVATVRELLSTEVTVSASEVARATGMARVTTRRYLEYLVATKQAVSTISPSGPGRPQKLYLAAGTVQSARPRTETLPTRALGGEIRARRVPIHDH